MRFLAVATLFVTGVISAPSPNALNSRSLLCSPGLYSTAQCCGVDVLGVADLDCAAPTGTITDAQGFQAACAKKGQEARCCILPVAGQDVLCQDPPGL